ncbi:hypothetical protein [Gallibacterium salpingitidis]|uniref:hypothetical protein n=1 Tax=Gallibacterium salpingitidis TaxID=505341 RepID=UPI0012E8A332|nr:hypothetical protein [Gallibacterium salpingitidis]
MNVLEEKIALIDGLLEDIKRGNPVTETDLNTGEVKHLNIIEVVDVIQNELMNLL